MAAEDDEVVEYVRSLEERATESDLSQANGDQIAREFERYLKRRGSDLRRRPEFCREESGPAGSPRANDGRLSAGRDGGSVAVRSGGSPSNGGMLGVASASKSRSWVVRAKRSVMPVTWSTTWVTTSAVGVPVAGRDLLGVGQVVVDQPADDVDGDVLLPGGDLGLVDPLEHERPQLVHRLERVGLP